MVCGRLCALSGLADACAARRDGRHAGALAPGLSPAMLRQPQDLDHPNVCKLHDWFESKIHFYMVFEVRRRGLPLFMPV
jgi:hypothetical protein